MQRQLAQAKEERERLERGEDIPPPAVVRVVDGQTIDNNPSRPHRIKKKQNPPQKPRKKK